MTRLMIRYRISILLFLTSFWIFGWMTNTSDVSYYGLYQVGAESIVEYHTYTLGHSLVPGWKDAGDGDVFTYQSKKFPAKQPGAFYATAVPYFFLHYVLNLNFINNQDEVAAYTTWFSGGFSAALCVALFYELLIAFGFTSGTSLWTSLIYAFGTILFSYSGVAHHDLMASVCLLFGFSRLYQFKHSSRPADLSAAGFALGFTLFFSMLPALIVACLGIYGLTLSSHKKTGLDSQADLFPDTHPSPYLIFITSATPSAKLTWPEITKTHFLSFHGKRLLNIFMITLAQPATSRSNKSCL